MAEAPLAPDTGARSVEPPSSPAGAPKRRRRLLWIAGLAVLLGVVSSLITDFYGEEEKALRTRLRETVKETFPEESLEFSRSFGLERFEGEGRPCVASGPGRGAVILVHGLDDPGKVWRSLAPRLCEEAFDVWVMRYPNDQPVSESARLLVAELGPLAERGIERVCVVAHSMGGLVSREMLTSPAIGYAALARTGAVPHVALLIMVGTPNHGSPLARFRALGEVRDQLARLTEGEASWLGGVLDGAGEAKIDLLPGSRFLTELNARPLPEGVEMLTIAGRASPWSEADIAAWIEEQKEGTTGDEVGRLDELGASLVSLTLGLGDGLVSVESTALPGVEHLTVDGTHLSMIRTVTEGSERVPPAVPIIVERLMGLQERMAEGAEGSGG